MSYCWCWADFIKLTFVVVSHEIFWRGCFAPLPRLLLPGATALPRAPLSYATGRARSISRVGWRAPARAGLGWAGTLSLGLRLTCTRARLAIDRRRASV